MSAPGRAHASGLMHRASVQRLSLALLSGAAGLAVNALPLGAVAPLMPGRVLTLPIAMLFGPWLGVLAAAIGALPLGGGTTSAFLVILPLEALIVGIFTRRGKSPLVAGGLVWGAAALSLVAAPWIYGVGYQRQTIWPIAMQTMLSGLVAVVVADLLTSGAAAQRLVQRSGRVERRRLSTHAFHAFVLAATLPILLLAAVDNQLSAARREADGGARLREAVTALAQHIEEYVAHHENAVRSLAAAMADPSRSSADRQRLVDTYPKIFPGFITLFDANRAGVVQEIFPPRDSETPPIADRRYFIDAVQSRRTTVSEVFLGRLSHVPIITIAVPIVNANNEVTGVAGGSLDLSKFDRFVDDFRTLADAQVTVLDHDNSLIYRSGAAGVSALQSLAQNDLVRNAGTGADGVYTYERPGPDAKGSTRIVASATVPSRGWKVFIEQPLQTLRLQSTGYYALTFALMLLALGAAILGARAFAGAVTRPLEDVVTP